MEPVFDKETERIVALTEMLIKEKFETFLKTLQKAQMPLVEKLSLYSNTIETLVGLGYEAVAVRYFDWRNRCYPLEETRGWYEVLPLEVEGSVYDVGYNFSSKYELSAFLLKNYHAYVLCQSLILGGNYEGYVVVFKVSKADLLDKWLLHHGTMAMFDTEKSLIARQKNRADLLTFISENFGSTIVALS
jgi:hypothetical protein